MMQDPRRAYAVHCMACKTMLTTVDRENTREHDRYHREGILCGTCRAAVKSFNFVLIGSS